MRRCLCPLAMLILSMTAPAVAAPMPDPAKVADAQAGLADYHDVLADIPCDVPSLTAHKLMCDNDALWQMGLLDSWAWVYATEVDADADHESPIWDETFIEERDSCADEPCLVKVLIRHTNDSLGDTSPYRK
jgi:hypothetical protein